MPTSILTGLLPLYIVRFSFFDIPTNLFELAVGLVFLYSIPKVKKITLPRSPLILIALFVFSTVVSVGIIPNLSPNFPNMSLQHGLGILKSWIIVPIIFAWLILPLNKKKLKEAFQYLTLSGTIVAAISFFTTPASLYDIPNSLALFITPLIIIAFWHKEWFKFSIMALALLYTQSLGGILAVGITIIASLSIKLKKPALLTLIPAIAFITLPAVKNSPTTLVRLQLWSISQDIITDHPILGIGLGQFEPVYQSYLHSRFATCGFLPLSKGEWPEGPRGCEGLLPEFIFRDPHNWILAFWLNTGLLGLVSFAALNILALKKSAKNRLWFLCFSISALLLHGFVDTIYWKNDLATLYWFLLFTVFAAQAKALPADRPN